jgi:hypothetical protein
LDRNILSLTAKGIPDRLSIPLLRSKTICYVPAFSVRQVRDRKRPICSADISADLPMDVLSFPRPHRYNPNLSDCPEPLVDPSLCYQPPLCPHPDSNISAIPPLSATSPYDSASSNMMYTIADPDLCGMMRSIRSPTHMTYCAFPRSPLDLDLCNMSRSARSSTELRDNTYSLSPSCRYITCI